MSKIYATTLMVSGIPPKNYETMKESLRPTLAREAKTTAEKINVIGIAEQGITGVQTQIWVEYTISN